MTALLLQTALLLLGAYFLGTFTGCLIRRAFFATVFVDPVQPQVSHAPAPPRRLPDPEPIVVPAAGISEAVGQAPQPAASAHFEGGLTGEAAAEGTDVALSHPAPAPAADAVSSIAPARPASAAPWAPAAQHKVADEGTPKPPARPQPSAQTPAIGKDHPPQDVDRGLAGPVPRARSVGTSAAAAAALAAATARHQAAQAALQEDDGQRKLTTAPAAPACSPVSAPVTTAAGAVPTPGAFDDFTRIRTIDGELQARLRKLGIHRFAEIAAWRKPDVRRIGEALGLRRGHIEQENWIEQAQILMSGGETAFSRRRQLRGQPLAKPTADQGERQRPMTEKPKSGAAASGTAAAVAASVVTAPRRPVMALGRDNLQRIRWISEDVERLLNVQGVSRYHQITRWTSSDVTRFERLLGSEGLISRENWIEQAQILAPGGETAYAREFDRQHAAAAPAGPRPTQLAEAIRTASQGTARKVDLSQLRSVRSEETKSGDAGKISAAAAGAGPDDLKRIRGIGVLIEKRLNSMGCRTYKQIANWTQADVDRVSQALEFRGRIERENWVEQARILASGGQTEFARRIDRGEIETSRHRP